MKSLKYIFTFAVLFISFNLRADFNFDQFKQKAEQIQVAPLRSWPLMHNGRIKPLETFASESIIFLTGKYNFKGLSPIQLIFALMTSDQSDDVELIEIRSPELRNQLNLPKDQRIFSANQLKKTPLESLAMPLSEKQKANKRSLSEIENKTLEAMNQLWLYQEIQSGNMLLAAMDPNLTNANHANGQISSEMVPLMQDLIKSIVNQDQFGFNQQAEVIKQKLNNQAWPESIKNQVQNIDRELLYNAYKPFRWACWLFFLMAVLLLLPAVAQKINAKVFPFLLALPLLFLIAGFYLRVSITGFAPVTNMYGTMIWVSLGVGLFGWLFYLIYRNNWFLSATYFGSFTLMLLTEQIPLIISPDMDPIVAVLRSNLWLTIHVLTITISYAAFTIAMILGNTMIVRDILKMNSTTWIKTYGHFCHRAIQLGVFLLSVGIILGGVWADYSWGRFWGWDPKETWALIADLGFLALLHARLIGWVDSYRLLLLAPLSYLLVIMAWYGVNFILATGLHSYGFSSGGAQIVFTFVFVQIVLILVSVLLKKINKSVAT